MKLIAATFAILLAAPAAWALEAPPGAMACSGCHATSASVDTPAPRLVGMKADDILAAMLAFRAGARPATVMDRIAKGFTESEAAAIAQWYATQPN
jgi:cytochrome c553